MSEKDILVEAIKFAVERLEQHYMGWPKDEYPGPPTSVVEKLKCALKAVGQEVP